METRAHYVAVGAFVLAMILLGFFALLWLGRVQLAESLERYYIFFKGPVAGLSKGSAVQYNGIPVGRVTDIRVDPGNIEQIQVTVAIDRNLVRIKTNARAYIDTNILSGVSTVQIRGGTQGAADLEPKPGHKYAKIPPGETSLQRVYASAPQLLERFTLVANDLHSLLKKKNRDAFGASLANLETLTGALAKRGEELHAVVENANATVLALRSLIDHVDLSYTGRNGLKDRLTRLVAHYDALSLSLADASRQFDTMMRENRPGVRDFTRSALPKADALLGQARRLLGRLDRTTAKIEENPSLLLFGEARGGYRPR
jgi:phospholipid/cholesterol/gamma-HCH transport system substrate-binding protein